jgi:hypothetical protein
MRMNVALACLVSSLALAGTGSAQVLIDDEDICAEHVFTSLENYSDKQGDIARVRATITGDFTGGEAKVAAGEYIYQPGEMMVAVYPQGETFIDGVYAFSVFRSDGPVDRELILLDGDDAQDYSSIMGRYVVVEVLLFDELGWYPITRNSCMEQTRVELFIEESVPADRSTMSSIKMMYR